MESDIKNIGSGISNISNISNISDLSEKKRKLITDFSTFSLELIKSLLRVGIYTDTHPITGESINKTFALFKNLKDIIGSITFILYESPDSKHDINVEGLISNWVSLRKILKGSVGEHFINKFSDLFRQNKIASITLSSSLNQEEFGKFINIFVSWRWQQDKAQESLDDFANALLDANVIGVTVVGIDELLGGERNLPWQIRVALTRIKKDLHKIPMLKGASPQQISNLKLLLLGEIARPIKYPNLILQLLTNVDIPAKEIPFIAPDEIIHFLIHGLVPGHLLNSASHLLAILNEDKHRAADEQKNLNFLLKSMVLELAQKNLDEAEPFLELCFKDGIINAQDMPRSLQRQIQSKRALDIFLSKRNRILNALLKTDDPHEATKILNVIMLAIAELVEKKDAESLNLIGFTLAKLYKEKPPQDFPGRKERIMDVLVGAQKGDMLDKLVSISCATLKENRRGMELLLALYGHDSVKPLIHVLTDTTQMGERRAAVDMLLALGSDALDSVVSELKSHRHPWYTLRNLLQVLGKIGGVREVSVANEFSDHPHPKVREQFIVTIENLLNKASESKIIRMLDDKDASVRKQAIISLARLNSNDSAIISKFKLVLEDWHKSEKHDMGCLIAVIRSLSFYDPLVLADREEIEKLLINLVKEPSGIRAMIPTLMGMHEVPLEIKLLVIQTLGYIGSTKSLDFLRYLQTSKEPRLIEEARNSMALIEKRGG